MTLSEMLHQAANQASQRGVSYIQENGTTIFQSYQKLLKESKRTLASLRQFGAKPGDKLILALSRNEEFILAFWACVLGRMLPVPLAAPPSRHKPSPVLEKLVNVWNLLDCPHILVDDQSQEQPSGPIPNHKYLNVHTLCNDGVEADVHQSRKQEFCTPKVKITDTAFIQFSSGSTGEPKGVMLSHKNIMASLSAIEASTHEWTDGISLSWMPLYHDMGLIGHHLVPMYLGANQFHINTMDFVRRPFLWLDSLEKHRVTVTACPNFGQALLLLRLERQLEKKWDLSSVRVMINAAEPIAVNVMQRFLDRLATSQLDPKAMLPIYGLAEATLAVTHPPSGEPPQIETLNRQQLQVHHQAVSATTNEADIIQFANEGFAVQGCEMRIVDDADRVLPDGSVGHIQIRGDNVTTGYYGNTQATRDAFCGEWLRTGDLGFIREGRLCITGRFKDILFINGQNYYAHDIENVAQQVEGVRSGRIAVCGWHDPQAGREKLLLFLVGRNPQLFIQVKQHLQRTLGLTVDVAIPLKINQFPTTTSGKLQRYKLREQFEQGVFDAQISALSDLLEQAQGQQAKLQPRTTTEKLLHRLWCETLVLNSEEVGIHDHFAELGGRSIHVMSILAGLEKLYHTRIHSEDIAEYHTIAEFAGYIDKISALRRTSAGGRIKRFRG